MVICYNTLSTNSALRLNKVLSSRSTTPLLLRLADQNGSDWQSRKMPHPHSFSVYVRVHTQQSSCELSEPPMRHMKMKVGKGAQVQTDNNAFNKHQFHVTTRDPEMENDIFNRKTHAV